MEMIDVLTKLKEIAESKPELVKDAVENVERTNPKAVTEGGMKDYLHDEAEKLSREEFIKKHGESLAGFWDSINGNGASVMRSYLLLRPARRALAIPPFLAPKPSVTND